MREMPLTPEQKAFAANNHGLVYKFLNKNQLPEDEFYDVGEYPKVCVNLQTDVR